MPQAPVPYEELLDRINQLQTRADEKMQEAHELYLESESESYNRDRQYYAGQYDVLNSLKALVGEL